MLLARYGYEERSAFVGGVRDLDDAEEFWVLVGGLEFWGGSGAVWEVEPFNLSHPQVRDASPDYRRFESLMIDLARLVKGHGPSPLAARMVDTAEMFRRDLDANG